MMRKKKTRGHRRRWKEIKNWVDSNSNLDIGQLNSTQRNYVKVYVYPWNGIDLENNTVPQPHGESKRRIISGLIDIYNSWKFALDQIEEPYYLKIWLYSPRISSSQVVCAVGGFIDFYNTTFFKPNDSKEFSSKDYGWLKQKLQQFNWSHHLDEEHYNNTEIGDPEDYNTLVEYEKEKSRFEAKLEKPHRTVVTNEPIGGATEFYSFKEGDIWIGSK